MQHKDSSVILENTHRVALVIEYDGTQYFGWQAQRFDGLSTIQETIEKAISSVADHEVEVVCAGRTDAGVHATGQVIHFDTSAKRPDYSWVMGVNANLPKDIVVRYAQVVRDDFHARYSAMARRYQYLILNSRVRSAVMADRACVISYDLDAQKMHEAAQAFIGEHDFSALRAAGCQAKSPVRNVEYFKIERRDSWICCEVQANAFLHHMVRNMMGVLITIGCEQQSVSWAKEVLASGDRKKAAVTADAQGLYLVKVVYPQELGFGGVNA